VHPDKIITSLDSSAAGDQAAPVLIAVTGEAGEEQLKLYQEANERIIREGRA